MTNESLLVSGLARSATLIERALALEIPSPIHPTRKALALRHLDRIETVLSTLRAKVTALEEQ